MNLIPLLRGRNVICQVNDTRELQLMWTKCTLFVVVFLFTTGCIFDVANGVPHCGSGWTMAGSYCYAYFHWSTLQQLDFAVRECAKINGTLAIFRTYQNWLDFYPWWQANPISNDNSYIGYAHAYGYGNKTDIVSIYDGSVITWDNFHAGEPNMAGGFEWCIQVYSNVYSGLWNDITCGWYNTNGTVCQQGLVFDQTTVNSVACAPVCQAVGPSGHRFATVLTYCTSNGMIVENKTIGYAMTMFADGLSDVVYEVNSTNGNTLMVYGMNAVTKLQPTYTIARLFFVANQKLVNTMVQFALVTGTTNGNPDSLIVEVNGTAYENAISDNWTVDGLFYLFTRYPGSSNYVCPFATDCEWNTWQGWSHCTVSCAGGTKTRSRTKNVWESNYGICNNIYSQTNNCSTQPCPINCVWSAWDVWWPCSVTCGGGEQNRTRTKIVVEKYGGYCSNNDTDTRICNTNHCPVDCVISNYSFTAPCSVTCGTGYELWTKTILINASYGGKQCPNVTMQEHRYCNIPVACFSWIIPVIKLFQCLFITFTISLCFGLFLYFKIFSLERYLHMCEEASLIIIHLLMSVLAWRYHTDKFDPHICFPNAILMQFFYMALFVFLLLESFQSYCIATNVISVKPMISTKCLMAIGWGIPALATTALTIRYHSSYKSQYSCWLNWGSSDLAVWTAFLIIVSGYCCVIFVEAGSKQISRPLPLLDVDKWTASVVSLYSMLFLIPLNTASWAVASIAIYYQDLYLHGAVVAINATLAISIFNFHTAADENVDDYVRKKICRCLRARQKKITLGHITCDPKAPSS